MNLTTKTKYVAPQTTYILELTEKEAKLLKALVGSVGGELETDPRKLYASIHNAFEDLNTDNLRVFKPKCDSLYVVDNFKW
jgi:hypothetical protein